ncbi:SNW/SKI-interacting protein A-like [Salvia hispanica]|uniref:SNW/SKI-interacting protein A-like n=1 Tax=Salvia hispanica TaxID=49212 RepID=UPI002009658A|nr:SNW/SKI-interacting protein A-like [Salvia hispanica]
MVEFNNSANSVPPYMKRAGFKPSKPVDFGDGGAFPEIHYAQYLFGIGRIDYANSLSQDENAKKIVYSQHSDLVPVFAKDVAKEDGMDLDEKQREIDETTQQTNAALEQIVNVRLNAAESKFIRYKPSQQSACANGRIIRVLGMAVDPLAPPKFKHKRIPRGSGSPPVPVMHSPPRPVTVKDQQEWKIPPCISNWKNSKGYVIPLDKRMAADGSGLQEVRISDNHAKLSEALYVGEQKAREAVAARSKVQKEMVMKEKEKKVMELRMLAQKARIKKSGVASADDGDMIVVCERDRDGPKETEDKKEERLTRQRERVRERRLEAKDGGARKKGKISRDRDRDITEKVALGMANTGAKGGEVMYDQRLFNQEKGMDSGFGSGTDDAYNIYDKGLFTAQSALTTLFKPKKDRDDEMYGGADEQLDKIICIKVDRAFTGTSERSGPRDGPVEFDKEQDPFGLDEFLKEVRMKESGGSKRDGSDKDLP